MDERKNSGANSEDDELGGLLETDDAEREALRGRRGNRFRDWPLREQPPVFLKRWKHRCTLRRIKLVEELLLSPPGPRKRQKLELWLSSLQSRKEWLEARWEHTLALESIVRTAIQLQEPNRSGDRPNESRRHNT